MHPRDIQADLQIAKSCVFFFLLPGSLGQTLLPASLETNDKPNALSEMEALETAVAVCLSVCLSPTHLSNGRPKARGGAIDRQRLLLNPYENIDPRSISVHLDLPLFLYTQR